MAVLASTRALPILHGRPLALQLGAIALGTLFLAVSSWIAVPMVPVPVTMQTFAVTIVGAIFGWRLGAVTVLAWLGEGMIGLPVFASGGGLAYFAGPTAGYLLAFPLMAAGVGFCAERGLLRGHWFPAFLVMLAANGLGLVIGTAWLSSAIGIERAIAVGATPFLTGAVLKSALAAAVMQAGGRLMRNRQP